MSDKSVKEVEKVKADDKDKADGMSKIMEVRSGMGMSKRVRRSWWMGRTIRTTHRRANPTPKSLLVLSMPFEIF